MIHRLRRAAKNGDLSLSGMAKTLKQVGFDVITVTNADQNKMKQAIKEFGRKLTSAGAQTPVRGRRYVSTVTYSF